jgi:hypothetical protein
MGWRAVCVHVSRYLCRLLQSASPARPTCARDTPGAASRVTSRASGLATLAATVGHLHQRVHGDAGALHQQHAYDGPCGRRNAPHHDSRRRVVWGRQQHARLLKPALPYACAGGGGRCVAAPAAAAAAVTHGVRGSWQHHPATVCAARNELGGALVDLQGQQLGGAALSSLGALPQLLHQARQRGLQEAGASARACCGRRCRAACKRHGQQHVEAAVHGHRGQQQR